MLFSNQFVGPKPEELQNLNGMQWNCPKESIVEDSDLVIDGMPGQANPGDYQMLFDGSLKVWKKLTTSPCTLYIKHFREMFGYLIRIMMDMIILKKTQMKSKRCIGLKEITA